MLLKNKIKGIVTSISKVIAIGIGLAMDDNGSNKSTERKSMLIHNVSDSSNF